MAPKSTVPRCAVGKPLAADGRGFAKYGSSNHKCTPLFLSFLTAISDVDTATKLQPITITAVFLNIKTPDRTMAIETMLRIKGKVFIGFFIICLINFA
jgi:hypothetical protein